MKKIRKLLCVMLSVFLVFFQISVTSDGLTFRKEINAFAITTLPYVFNNKCIKYNIYELIEGQYYAEVCGVVTNFFPAMLDVGKNGFKILAYISRTSLPSDIDIPKNIDKIPVTSTSSLSEKGKYGITGMALSPYVHKIIFPSTMTWIGSYSFRMTAALETLDLPATLNGLSPGAFCQCPNLTEVTVRNPNCDIHKTAFDDCNKLTKIYGYSGSTAEKFAKAHNIDFYVLDTGEIIPASTTATTVTTKATTTTTKTTTVATTAPLVYDNLVYSFSGNCATVTGFNSEIQNNVEIPQKVDGHQVTAIAASAFRNCTSLESIKIPNSVTEIGANAFYICTNLNSVTILNPYCTIDKNCKIPGKAVIYGYSGSTAQEFAETNGNEFVALDAPATTVTSTKSTTTTTTTTKATTMTTTKQATTTTTTTTTTKPEEVSGKAYIDIECIDISLEDLKKQNYQVSIQVKSIGDVEVTAAEFGIQWDKRLVYIENQTGKVTFSANDSAHMAWMYFASSSPEILNGIVWNPVFTLPEDASPGDVYSVSYLKESAKGSPHIWQCDTNYGKIDYVASGEVGWTDGYIRIVNDNSIPAGSSTAASSTTTTVNTTETTTTTIIPNYYEEPIVLSIHPTEISYTVTQENNIIYLREDEIPEALHLGVYFDKYDVPICWLSMNLFSDTEKITFLEDTFKNPANYRCDESKSYTLSDGTSFSTKLQPYILGRISDTGIYESGCTSFMSRFGSSENSLTATWMYGYHSNSLNASLLDKNPDKMSFVEFDICLDNTINPGTYQLYFNTGHGESAFDREYTYAIHDESTRNANGEYESHYTRACSHNS